MTADVSGGSVREPGLTTSQADERDRGAGAVWLLVALLGLGGFALLTIVIAGGATFTFDQPLLTLFSSWNQLTTLWKALSDSANIPLIVIGLGMVAWLFFTHHRREALVVLLILIAVTAGSEGVKQLVARQRPLGTDPAIPGVVYSYPSGHVLEALTIFGIIAIRGWRSSKPTAARVALVVLVIVEVLLVGVARIALQEHYPSDILAGILAGIGVLGCYGWLTRPGGIADDHGSRASSSTGPSGASHR